LKGLYIQTSRNGKGCVINPHQQKGQQTTLLSAMSPAVQPNGIVAEPPLVIIAKQEGEARRKVIAFPQTKMKRTKKRTAWR